MADSWVPVVLVIVAAVFGFVGVIIGGIVTGWFTIRAERLRAEQAEAVGSARRRDERLLDRDNFQRATLLGIQDVAGGLVTLAAQVHANDSASFAKTSAARVTSAPETSWRARSVARWKLSRSSRRSSRRLALSRRPATSSRCP